MLPYPYLRLLLDAVALVDPFYLLLKPPTFEVAEWGNNGESVGDKTSGHGRKDREPVRQRLQSSEPGSDRLTNEVSQPRNHCDLRALREMIRLTPLTLHDQAPNTADCEIVGPLPQQTNSDAHSIQAAAATPVPCLCLLYAYASSTRARRCRYRNRTRVRRRCR